MRTRAYPVLIAIALLSCYCPRSLAQLKDPDFVAGVRIGGVLGADELKEQKGGYQARGFARYRFLETLSGELGIGFGELHGISYQTQIIPVDIRALWSFVATESWSPFLYAGLGASYFERRLDQGGATNSWMPIVPVGAGIQIMLDENVYFELTGGFTYTFYDGLFAAKEGSNDAVWGLLVGVTAFGENEDADPDKDGLVNREEKVFKTDPKNPDTDGDGLRDGEEVHQYKTDPLNPDTDGDGLKDGDEVRVHRTNPLNPDTDADGLQDGAEVLTHKTDPLKPDTDGDGLLDGAEVARYKTDPLKIDTDNGTVADGIEVGRGTDPLNPADDLPRGPKRETLHVEVGKALVLEGIVFKTGSAEISYVSEGILQKVFNTLDEYRDIVVEIRGHTDNVGKASFNLKLSEKRAEAVREWLVQRGIAPARITARGFGWTMPIVPNTTTEGKQANRRIEFFRTK